MDPTTRDREDLQAVWPILVPLVFAASAALIVAAPGLLSWTASGHRALVLLALCATATALERSPVALPEGEWMHMTAIVVLYVAVVYGATLAIAVALVYSLTVQIVSRKVAAKLVYNVAQSVLAAGLAGLAARYAANHWHALPLTVAAAALALLSANLGLVSLARARSTSSPWRIELRRSVAMSATTGALMATVVPFLIIGVRASPWYAVLAIGPLVAIRLQLSANTRAIAARQEALTDPLTGLGNRRLFDDRLASEIERADRRDVPLGVCLIDLDGLKFINDHFGHLVGDEALMAVASTSRRGGEAFRYAGDEFALVLPEHDEQDAAAIADAVSGRVRELEVEGVSLSISYGLAIYRRAGPLLASQIVQVADEHLYIAKRNR